MKKIKKITYFLLIIFSLIIISSCAQNTCPAYGGEKQKFQKNY